MKQKLSSSNLLPIKLLFLSYLKNYETCQTVSDCHSALSNYIIKLSQNITQNYNQIVQIAGIDIIDNKNNKMMDIIYEEQFNTERQNNSSYYDQYDDYYNNNDKLFKSDQKYKQQNNIINNKNNIKHQYHHNTININTKKFNLSIAQLQKINNKFHQIMYMYKNQLKSIAKDLTQQKQLNKKLSNQIKQLNLLINNNNKHRTNSLNKISNKVQLNTNNININKNKQIVQKHDKKLVSTNTSTTSTSRSNNVSKIKQNKLSSNNKQPSLSFSHLQSDPQQQQIRPAPRPFCVQCLKLQNKQNKQKSTNLIQEQRKQQQQKYKWRQLSNKITNLKSQLTSYQSQLFTKQTQINSLTQQLNKIKSQQICKQTQEKKKIKSINTTLRGQKIVLENTIQNIKRKNQQLTQSNQILQKNLLSTIKYQQNTINDLKNNQIKQVKSDKQLQSKYQQAIQLNKILYQKISEQQKYLQQFINKLKQISIIHQKQINKLKQKNYQLQGIIQQKNQTIIKIKLQSTNRNNKNIINLNCNPNPNHTNNNNELLQLQSKLLLSSQRLQKQQEQTQRQLQYYINKRKQENSLYGTIMTKTLKKQLQSSSFNNNYNSQKDNINKSSGFQNDMIKILNKKLTDKQNTIEKLQQQNYTLKKQFDSLLTQLEKQNQQDKLTNKQRIRNL